MKPICRFGLDEGIKAIMVQWLQQEPRDFFARKLSADASVG
jgi:hypothetical protein